MTNLFDMHCKACEGGIPALTLDEAKKFLKKTPDWIIDKNGKKISREFKFKNFYHTMAFVNAIAWIANRENHHPDLELGYNYCHVHFTTHALDGLSENDFICAAKIDQLHV
ncbi:MAG: 4a-hydroxytetrahydrobiopterin dehydratase [Gammaproteobacteria bacterium]